MSVNRPDHIPAWNVANKLQRRKLLIAINCIAALSIFFFGYDQGGSQNQLCDCSINPPTCHLLTGSGMMGGVNNATHYIYTMGFGYVDEAGDPVINNSILQGGIVSVYYLGTLFGALLGGWVGEKIGRIKTIALGAVWAIVGAALQCSAQNHNWMICGESTCFERSALG